MSILDAVLNKSFGPVFVKENTESEFFFKENENFIGAS